MAHRNKGNGKTPKTNARPRTWRRWRIRHNPKETIVTGSHTHIDKNAVDNSG